MSRRPFTGDPTLRRVLETLHARAEARVGSWQIAPVDEVEAVGWRLRREGDRDRHELSVSVTLWARERAGILAALPQGFAPLAVEAGEDAVRLRLARPADRCARCGEAMDDTARWMLAEECSACALELGLLQGAAV